MQTFQKKRAWADGDARPLLPLPVPSAAPPASRAASFLQPADTRMLAFSSLLLLAHYSVAFTISHSTCNSAMTYLLWTPSLHFLYLTHASSCASLMCCCLFLAHLFFVLAAFDSRASTEHLRSMWAPIRRSRTLNAATLGAFARPVTLIGSRGVKRLAATALLTIQNA